MQALRADIFFTYHAPVLWGAVPIKFRKPVIHSHFNLSYLFALLLALSKPQFQSEQAPVIFSLVCFAPAWISWLFDLA